MIEISIALISLFCLALASQALIITNYSQNSYAFKEHVIFYVVKFLIKAENSSH
jgi:hypothetical protein